MDTGVHWSIVTSGVFSLEILRSMSEVGVKK